MTKKRRKKGSESQMEVVQKRPVFIPDSSGAHFAGIVTGWYLRRELALGKGTADDTLIGLSDYYQALSGKELPQIAALRTAAAMFRRVVEGHQEEIERLRDDIKYDRFDTIEEKREALRQILIHQDALEEAVNNMNRALEAKNG